MNDQRPQIAWFSDAELVSRIQRGTDLDESFRELFRRYHGGVRHFFRRKGLSGEDCADLTQETFFRVHRYIETFYGGSVKGWLFSIALNVYRNEVRRCRADKRRGWEVPLPKEATDPQGLDDRRPEMIAPGPQPEAEALSRERLRALQHSLDGMPPQMRRCVKLRVWGHPIQQIAHILGRAPDTVKVHLHKARKRLQEELGQRFGEPGF
jgi:RNA polymerase sigma-70 factor (ECF subfamily)